MKPNPPSVKNPVKIPVLLPLPFSEPFTYTYEKELLPGTVVKVPFGSRQLFGVVWENNQESTPAKKKPAPISYKPIEKVIEDVRLPEVSLKFIQWVSEYIMAPQGQILKMVIAIPEVFEKAPKTIEYTPTNPQKPHLSKEQQIATESILQSLNRKPFLLEGVTGSGKTEVYFEIIESILKEGGQSLILLPEIALSTQWLQRFKARFGFEPAVWHSDLPPGKRKATYKAIIEGKAAVTVGARSALFLPFSNLKLVIVDEEHDGSYKQEEGVIYNARDMAVVRAKLSDACCILASATPSLESEMNVRSEKYGHIQLTSRYGGAQFPDVKLIDLRKVRLPSQSWISPQLRTSLEETLQRGEQAMLFLNRRGYAPLTLCEGCGERIMCPQCSISLVQHKSHSKLLCHHCGYLTSQPSSCSACHAEDSFKSIGPGVERIYEEVKTFLPEARCALLTSDHLTTPKKIKECVENIQNHEVDFLIGTQIMAKGHHFPLLTLVGVIDGDSALSGSDLRAAEKSFQLLHQVAGRSGREARQGQVFIQTYLPEHPLMQALVHHNKAQFLALEGEQRQLHDFPPFGRLAALILSGKKKEDVEKAARILARTFPETEKAILLGPTPAPLSYLRGRHRWRLLIKTAKHFPIQSLLQHWLSLTPLHPSLKLQIDIDPYSFF